MSKKYLIGDGAGQLYTVSSNALIPVEGDISAALFVEHGADTVPDGGMLKSLDGPQVYCWSDTSIAHLKARIKGRPAPQTVYTRDIDMSDKTIIGVESVEITGDDDTLYAVSVDGGTTWHNYVGGSWVELSEATSGQNRKAIESIGTTAWSEFAITGSIMFRFTLAAAANTVQMIKINYLNKAHGEPTKKELKSIEVKKPPNKQIYVLGETLNLTGISVVADYDNDTRADVTLGCTYSINDGDPLVVPGIQDVIVCYTENGLTRTASFEINVKEAD